MSIIIKFGEAKALKDEEMPLYQKRFDLNARQEKFLAELFAKLEADNATAH